MAISARGRQIHFMFGSPMRFSESADRMALFPVSPIQDGGAAAILIQDGGAIGGSDGAISGFAKSKVAAQPPS